MRSRGELTLCAALTALAGGCGGGLLVGGQRTTADGPAAPDQGLAELAADSVDASPDQSPPDGRVDLLSVITCSCAATDPCHAPDSCDPTTGRCRYLQLSDGTPCAGDDRCFASYVCRGGACSGEARRVCEAAACHLAACDPASGMCLTATAPDGTSCPGPDPCSKGALCKGGTCSQIPSACRSSDPCQVSICNGASAQCELQPAKKGTVCVGPNACDRYACSGGTCTALGLGCPQPADECLMAVCNTDQTCQIQGRPALSSCANGIGYCLNAKCVLPPP